MSLHPGLWDYKVCHRASLIGFININLLSLLFFFCICFVDKDGGVLVWVIWFGGKVGFVCVLVFCLNSADIKEQEHKARHGDAYL